MLPEIDARMWRIAMIAIVCIALAAVGYYRLRSESGYPLDDSWIHLAYAKNIAGGHGFGANPGESTPGATSPLWVLLLAPGFIFGAAHAVWPWLLGALVLGAAGVFNALLVRRLGRVTLGEDNPSVRWAAILCGVTIVLTAPLVWSAAGAMEVPLFVALIAAALLVFAGSDGVAWKRGVIWGLLVGLAGLARPEGLILAPLLAVLTLAVRNRGAVIECANGALASVMVYSPSVAFCLTTNGRPFPNTFYAKTTALVTGAPDVEFLTGVIRFMAEFTPVVLLGSLAGVVAIILLAPKRSVSRGVLATVGFLVGLPLAYAVMGRTFLFAQLAGNSGRYLYPLFPSGLALGFWAGAVLMHKRPKQSVVSAVMACMVIGLGYSFVDTNRRLPRYRHNVRDINSMQVEMAKRLKRKLPPGTLVAANDVGALAYLTDFRVLDLVGIISTQTLDALEPAGNNRVARDAAYIRLLRDERPGALVVFPHWFASALVTLENSLTAIEVIDNPSNVTSGGPRLAAFQIDWSKN